MCVCACVCGCVPYRSPLYIESDVKLHHLRSLSDPLKNQEGRLQSGTLLPTGSLDQGKEGVAPRQDVFQGPVTVVEASDRCAV